MTDEQPNPFASPTATSVGDDPQLNDRSVAWQHSVARVLRWVPAGIGYHVLAIILAIILNLISLSVEQTRVSSDELWILEVLVAVFLVFLFVASLSYHSAFGSLLYGYKYGLFWGYLAIFPIIGGAALRMFVVKAQSELRQHGWQVTRFTATPPAEPSD